MNTESAQGSPENLTEAPWLDMLLREDAGYREDLLNDDFTRQVLARLPASHMASWSWIAPAMGALTVLILVLVMPAKLSFVGSTSAAEIAGMWFPGLLLSMFAVAAAIAVAGILTLQDAS